ncbi:MAG: 5-(carboxyamino)imidazole ribonucleotide mutase [Candidatus Marsarchaeota archaeon]|nr:5-(carboxyamino)imidazole ribonucleotide mutase [Candidatus Marsarchaeota archaeon]
MSPSKPLVGILMGSKSDLEVMSEAAKVLGEFGIMHEMKVASAHRTPELVHEYVSGARGRGVKVIIAGAGGSAHLAGVCAAHTTLPVIGVPVQSKSLNGLDSLLSTVQMPPGVPVACVGINAAKNAGLLAVQMLALEDRELAGKLTAYRKKMSDDVKAIKL